MPPVGWAPPTVPGPEMVGGAHPTKSGPLTTGAPRNTRNRERYPTMSRAPERSSGHRLAWRGRAGNNEDDPNPPSGRGRDEILRLYDDRPDSADRPQMTSSERPVPLQVEGRLSPAAASLHVKCPRGRDLRGAARAGGRSDHLLVVPRLRPGPCAGEALGGWVAKLLRMAARPDPRREDHHHAPLDRRAACHRRTGAWTSLEAPLGAEDQGLGADPGRLGRGPAAGAGDGRLRRGCSAAGARWRLRRPGRSSARWPWIWKAPSSAWAWWTALVLPLIIASEGHTPPRLTPGAGAGDRPRALTLGPAAGDARDVLPPRLGRGSGPHDRLDGEAAPDGQVLATLLDPPLSLPMIEAVLLLLTKLTVTLFFPGHRPPPQAARYPHPLPLHLLRPGAISRAPDRHARRERLARLRLLFRRAAARLYDARARSPRLASALKTSERVRPGPHRHRADRISHLPDVFHPGDRRGHARGPGRPGCAELGLLSTPGLASDRSPPRIVP